MNKRRDFPLYLSKGEKFGNLVVIGPDDEFNAINNKTPYSWKYTCLCNLCGRTVSVFRGNLLQNRTTKCKSCASKVGNAKWHTPNPTKEHGNYIEVFFKTTNGSFVLDKEDYYKYVVGHSWYYSKRGYVESRIDNKLIKLHQLLFDYKYPVIDHRDGNPLNNKRSNLNPGAQSDNCKNQNISTKNTSGYKGVSAYGKNGKFIARIKIDYMNYHIGVYSNKTLAGLAYDIASRILHGQCGKTNQDLNLLNPEEIPLDTRKEIEYKVKQKLRSKGVEV